MGRSWSIAEARETLVCMPKQSVGGGIGVWGMGLGDDDDVCIGERRKLEGETENMGVCTKKWKGMTAELLMERDVGLY